MSSRSASNRRFPQKHKNHLPGTGTSNQMLTILAGHTEMQRNFSHGTRQK
jgi:hypothetical protein